MVIHSILRASVSREVISQWWLSIVKNHWSYAFIEESLYLLLDDSCISVGPLSHSERSEGRHPAQMIPLLA